MIDKRSNYFCRKHRNPLFLDTFFQVLKADVEIANKMRMTRQYTHTIKTFPQVIPSFEHRRKR